MKKLLKNDKGLTSIESILALAVIIIVIAVAYNIFFTENNIFTISEYQADVQRDVRIATDFVIKELRNATVIGNKEKVRTSGDLYHCLKLEDNENGNFNSLLRQTFTVEDDNNPLSEYRIGGTLSNLKFSSGDDNGILKTTIVSTMKNQEYKLEFELLLNNINNIEIEGEVSEIYYIKVEDI